MSFYFQPLIFAVPTTPAIHSHTYYPVSALTAPTIAIQPVQFPCWLQLYTTPAPTWLAVSSALPIARSIPGTVPVRVAFYGHGPGGLWCRATEATYPRDWLPNRARLKADIGRWAMQHGLLSRTWWARVMVMDGLGLVILPDVGPVLNGDVVMVELREGGGGDDDDDDATEGQLGELLTRVQKDQVVYVLVCMDEHVEAGTAANGDGGGMGGEQAAAVREGEMAEAVRTEESGEQQDMTSDTQNTA